ncbi:MAG: glucosidase [Verrucomicrobiota bacterium]|nr:glucosidase [Verrucomicrobiota bacterium]
MESLHAQTAEGQRLIGDAERQHNWKRWGPYLSERQWATVREDYSADGDSWNYFPHDHARSRAYRWGEDGLLGITDRQCRLCFAVALWNGRDPILKERLFGLTGPEGNHGEDVKELYYYLDSTPTHSYMRALYKYPQAEYPYARLIEANRRRGLGGAEFELIDTGLLDENHYFDVFAEYAKAGENDMLIRLTIANRGPEKATLHLLPTLWFRNTWSWGDIPEECTGKPSIRLEHDGLARVHHDELGEYEFGYEGAATPLFTDNETNTARLFGNVNGTRFSKDAFHERIIHGRADATNPANVGTKFSPHYMLELGPGEERIVRLRLREVVAGVDDSGGSPSDQSGSPTPATTVFESFDQIFAQRIAEADEFYNAITPAAADEESRNVARQAYAGLLWSKQFYNYQVEQWLTGDPGQPAPPAERWNGRNREWQHLFSRDVISMPDKWEYPWFAAWDLAFHMVPFAKVDPDFAKKQLELFLREWYMHPNGQIPAYEFAFGDVNPPVHAWAAWRVYKMTGPRGERDTRFLESTFQKLLLNFTWWVNRKDADGNNLFSGGFLGLDNIGVFDRSKPLPTGGHLQQADGTAWMGFYCLTMLSMALELAETNPVYEDMASKFFEHFVAIADAMNTIGGTGLWDADDGFYYDKLKTPSGREIPLRTRSLVGLLPLIAVEVIADSQIAKLRGFKKRMDWFLAHRKDLHESITYCELCPGSSHRMLAIPTKERLTRALRYMLDENEFLSPFGLRSVSRFHHEHPYVFRAGNEEHRVDYVPGEANSYLFGGNSNWRGPIWFPINYLIVEALERYHHYYGDDFQVECPTGSGKMMNLDEVAQELSRRLTSIFLPNENGARPCHGEVAKYATDPHFKELVLFYEYFHGETGRGCGASHQTGWTALAVKLLENATDDPDQEATNAHRPGIQVGRATCCERLAHSPEDVK